VFGPELPGPAVDSANKSPKASFSKKKGFARKSSAREGFKLGGARVKKISMRGYHDGLPFRPEGSRRPQVADLKLCGGRASSVEKSTKQEDALQDGQSLPRAPRLKKREAALRGHRKTSSERREKTQGEGVNDA